ncbi:MAG: M20 family metallo-hydrolase [Bacteroidota bacterium]|nr:M20 family metallo-hydrolase [Bacteroidota bacterium]
MQAYHEQAISLLKQLIAIPSFSREEDKTADVLFQHLVSLGFAPERKGNNVWVKSVISESLPTILLNSHHDTVKPTAAWTLDPFNPVEKDGKLFGLGSNDAGAPLVSLLMTFVHFSTQKERPFNLIFSATAEEEVTGKGGVESIIPELGKVDLAIVGEPTQMQMAVASKGLMVLDCKTIGKTGHAARNEGINALYLAIDDIDWFRAYQFPEESELLGPVKMSVTVINAGTQHNVVPAECSYVVDVRTNEYYSNVQALEIIRQHVKNSEVTPRSTRLNSSRIDLKHPLVKRGIDLGLTYFGSPTSSDQMVIPYPSIKIGPGDSARSHSADEFIYPEEIKQGIETYIKLLDNINL